MGNPNGHSMPPISDVEVARRLHFAGFFFLPWLWLVSSLHFYEASKTNPEIAHCASRCRHRHQQH